MYNNPEHKSIDRHVFLYTTKELKSIQFTHKLIPWKKKFLTLYGILIRKLGLKSASINTCQNSRQEFILIEQI